MSTNNTTPLALEAARQHLCRLGFYGLLAHAEAVINEPWLTRVLEIEETERQRRRLKRRLEAARLGAFRLSCSSMRRATRLLIRASGRGGGA